MSCDSYSDAWPYFTLCWDRFWADCPFDVFLISEQKSFNHPKTKNIKIGKRVGWADMLLHVLPQIKTDYIIYMQEDYLLKGKIDNDWLFGLLNIFEHQQAAYLRLLPWPNPDELLPNNSGVGIINKKSPYKTSLQAAVWDKEVLNQLTFEGESGWDFESKSVERSDKINKPFLSVYADVTYENLNNYNSPLNYFATGILNGKWMIECIRHFKNIGISINPGARGVLSRWDYFYYQFKKNNKNVFYEKLNQIIFKSAWFNKLYFSFLKFINKI